MGSMPGFEDALIYLKTGGKVSRNGWNGKGLTVSLQTTDINSKMGRNYLYITCSDGISVPWVPSQTDLLANDWNLHPKE